ncbi:MAG: YigZ family protein [Coriobacteriaceae bacterium]|jgi:uncharacterized YigZ family protein|nr:YigZ family protein [Coriobacteriaceae bacterium]
MSSYTTIEGRSMAEVIDRKSRFIAQAAPAASEEAALAFLDSVRCAHRMARHNVYAYVLREKGRVRYSDDGEPPKTAGLPTLEAIRHAGLTDVIVVVTRYFGGTLLGTGGLVRAYTQAAQKALEAARQVRMSACVAIEASLPYGLYEQMLRLLEAEEARVVERGFTDKVALRVLVLEEALPQLEPKILDLLHGQGTLEVGDPHEAPF